jgi:hypothetical protein
MSNGWLGSAPWSGRLLVAIVAIAMAAACSSGSTSTTVKSRRAPRSGTGSTIIRRPTQGSTITQPPAPAAGGGSRPPLFAHYYLWWDSAHWRAKLGSAYPADHRPPRLPATLDAAGCTATPSFPGVTLIDVPAPPLGLYSQDDPATLAAHVDQAAGAGIDGFVVSWSGNGDPAQRPSSSPFDRRLDLLVRAVNAHNTRTGDHFALMLGYQGLDNARAPRPAARVATDLDYFTRTYVNDPAFHVPVYGSKPVVMLLDSRKFAVPTLKSLLAPRRASLTLIGDEHGLTEWQRGVAPLFDGDGWYWSAENPATNRGAATMLTRLSDRLHVEHKLWFSPLSAGYNKSSFGIGGTCVPRRGGSTLRTIYDVNRQSNPDGWMLISWNEIFENTYVEPSVRYGTTFLDAIRSLRA